MASYDALKALAEHPDRIALRSDRRVFPGEPGLPEATKTTVEPGNVASRGMRSFGVTWWLRFAHESGAPQDDGRYFNTTETAPLDSLRWRYEGGYLPLLHCETQLRGIAVQHSPFQDSSTRTFRASMAGAKAATTLAQRTPFRG
jgi:hypothetical protein